MDVTDVVALPAADPSGIGLAAIAVPLALGGIATAACLMFAFGGRAAGAGRAAGRVRPAA